MIKGQKVKIVIKNRGKIVKNRATQNNKRVIKKSLIKGSNLL